MRNICLFIATVLLMEKNQADKRVNKLKKLANSVFPVLNLKKKINPFINFFISFNILRN